MSKQMTFTLACAVILSALGPGVAGYLTARLESIEAAESNLRALEARLLARQARDARPASYPCLRTPTFPRYEYVPKRLLHDMPSRLAWPSSEQSAESRQNRHN